MAVEPIHDENCTMGGGVCVNMHCPDCGVAVNIFGQGNHTCGLGKGGSPFKPKPASPNPEESKP